jgi:hypothetical protein
MAKDRINLTIARAAGRTSKLAMSTPSAAMMEMAEALAEFMSTGVNPHALCGTCGRRRDDHRVRHVFVEPVWGSEPRANEGAA